MAEERDRREEEEMNDENDAREEDIVKDTDADTREEIDTEQEHYDDVEARFKAIEVKLDKMLGQLSAMREAQGIMVENGAVITEPDAEIDFTGADSFVPPAELDLLI